MGAPILLGCVQIHKDAGVRDLDEYAPNGTGTATVGNARDKWGTCSNCCSGPLSVECHAEGEIFGQAFWHLSRSLLAGVDAENPALADLEAWKLLERLVFASNATVTTYFPASDADGNARPEFPGGKSAYIGFLEADDEGDGIANGTPHAAYLNEAFGHHEMTDDLDQPHCPALYSHALTTHQMSMLPIGQLSDEQITRLLTAKKQIEQYLKGVYDMAMRRVQAGTPLDGWKVVESIGNRRWKDESEVIKLMKRQKVPADSYAPRKLVSPAQAKGLCGQSAD